MTRRFVFVRKDASPTKAIHDAPLRVKEEAERIANSSNVLDIYDVFELVPASLDDEPVTTTRKVIR